MITASLGRGTLTVLDRRGALLARVQVVELVPRRLFLRAASEALRKPYRIPGGSFRVVGNMAPMKRLLLLAVLVVAATAIPAQASAAGPCRNEIYDDWYQDGKIASTYPISCYRDAIKHVHGDAQIYSSLTDDIRAAMQAAISRAHGKSNVPNQVGKGVPASETVHRVAGRTRAATRRTGRTHPSTSSTIASPPVADSGDGSGVPVPLLVLGGLALLLAAAGGIGMLARRRGDTTSPSCRAARGA